MTAAEHEQRAALGLPDRRVHRANFDATPRCGAEGETRISTSGVLFDCEDCLALDKPLDRAEAIRQMEEAAARYRSRQA